MTFIKLAHRFVLLVYLWSGCASLAMAQSPPTANRSYGPVKSGDMLWGIASQVRPNKQVSRYQVMQALLVANPQAFRVSCNMNSLKVGATLRVPSLNDIQTLSHNEAVRIVKQQERIWRQSRRSGQAIVCPEPVVATPQTQPQPVEELAVTTTELDPVVTTPPIEPPSPTTESVTTPVVAAIPSPPPANYHHAPSETTPPVPQQTRHTMLPIPLWWVGVAAFMGLFLLAMILGWLLHRATKPPTTESTTPEEEPPQDTRATAFALASDHAPKPKVSHTNHSLQEKLSSVRTYLAEGENQAIQTILQEVLAQGTGAQQAEARQLLEINKKMHTADKEIAKEEDTVLSEVIETNRQIPTPVQLPDNEIKLFELIDKVFVLLDRELNAKGQLIEAYQRRHQQQNEGVIETQVKVEKTIQRDPPPRRYL